MGYTHYWDNIPATHDPDTWIDFVNDIRKVFGMNPMQPIEEHLPVAGFHGEGDPWVNIQKIAFNGVLPAIGEGFSLVRENSRRPHGCCKTSWLPYDVAVCATLLLYKHYFPEITISSDGKEEDWAPAEKLIKERIGKTLKFIK